MKHFVVFVTLMLVVACREEQLGLVRVQAVQTSIDSTLIAEDSLDLFIKPYRDHVIQELTAPLAFAPNHLSKTDGSRNSSLGNLMADIILEQTNSLLGKRGERQADLALLNHGGIRNVISTGPVSEQTAYEVMPFENTISVVPMPGKAIREMVAFLIAADRPHPIGGMEIHLGPDGTLKTLNIGGESFDEGRTYLVATSSYLVGGGDGMVFFEGGGPPVDTGYKIRNAMVDYFKQVDTLRAATDNRFTPNTVL